MAMAILDRLEAEGLDTSAPPPEGLTGWEQDLVRAQALLAPYIRQVQAAEVAAGAPAVEEAMGRVLDEIGGMMRGEKLSPGARVYLPAAAGLAPKVAANGTLVGRGNIERLSRQVTRLSRAMLEWRARHSPNPPPAQGL